MPTSTMPRVHQTLKMSTLEVPVPHRPTHTPSPLASTHLNVSTASLAISDSSGGDYHVGDPSSGRGRSQTASSAQTLPSLTMSGRTGSFETVDSPSGGYGTSATPSSASSLAIIPEAAGETDLDEEDHPSPSIERGRKRDVKPLSPFKVYRDDNDCKQSGIPRMRQSSNLDQIFMAGRRPHVRQRSSEIRQTGFRPSAPPELQHLGQGQGRPTLVHKASLSSLAQTETTVRPRALSRGSFADSEAIAVLSARAQSARPPYSRNPDATTDAPGRNRCDSIHGGSDRDFSSGAFEIYKKLHEAVTPDRLGSIARWRSTVAPSAPGTPAKGRATAAQLTKSTSLIRPPSRPHKPVIRGIRTEEDRGSSDRPNFGLFSTSRQSFVTPKRKPVVTNNDAATAPESPLDRLHNLLSSLPRINTDATASTSDVNWFSRSQIHHEGPPTTGLPSLPLAETGSTPTRNRYHAGPPPPGLGNESMDIDDSPLKSKAQINQRLGASSSGSRELGPSETTPRRPAAEPMEVDQWSPMSPIPLVKKILRPNFSRIHTHPPGRIRPEYRAEGPDVRTATARSGDPLGLGGRFSGFPSSDFTTSTPVRPSVPPSLGLFKQLQQPVSDSGSSSLDLNGAGPSRRGSLLRPGAYETPVRHIATNTISQDCDDQTPSPLGQRLSRIEHCYLPPRTPAGAPSLHTPFRPSEPLEQAASPIGTLVISGGLPVKRSSMASSAQRAPPEAPKKAAPRRHTTISSKPAPLKLHRRTPSENPFLVSVKAAKGLRPLATQDTNKRLDGEDCTSPDSPVLEKGGDPGDFEVVDTLGSGSFGEVTKVIQKSTGKVLAKKCIRGNTSSSSERREEVAILRYLSRRPHRGIIDYIASWETHTSVSECHIVTSFSPNGTLKSHLLKVADQGGMGESGAWRILHELSLAVEHIHDLRICHHDIKPDNILIGPDHSLVLADFGVASGVDQRGTLVNTCPTLPVVLSSGWHTWPREVVEDVEFVSIAEHEERSGDKTYMPREGCLGGKDVGLPVDIFALGMVILEVACNVVLPIEGDEWHQLRSDDFRILKSNFTPRHRVVDPLFDQAYTPPRPILTSDLLDLIFDQMIVSDSRQRSTISTIKDHPILRYLSTSSTSPQIPALSEAGDGEVGWFIDYLAERWSYTADCVFQRTTSTHRETPPKTTPKPEIEVENPFLAVPSKPRPEIVDNPFLTVTATATAKPAQNRLAQTRQSRAKTFEDQAGSGPRGAEGSRSALVGGVSRLPRWKGPAVHRTGRKPLGQEVG